VIQAARAPVLLIELADYGGAALVEGRQQLVGLRGLVGKDALEPLALVPCRGVDKDVEAARLSGQSAGRAAAHQHAIALLGGAHNLLADERQHALGVEELVFGEAGHGKDRVLPEHLAVAVVPGVEALVEACGQLGVHSGRARRAGCQLRIQQPPSQALRQFVRKLPAVRAVLTLHRNHPCRCFRHGLTPPPTGAYNGSG